MNGHSASLSSMESEGEVPRPVRHSTHSLNDNDLAVSISSTIIPSFYTVLHHENVNPLTNILAYNVKISPKCENVKVLSQNNMEVSQ